MNNPLVFTWKKGVILSLLGVLLTGVVLEIGLRAYSYLQIQQQRKLAKVSSPEGEYWPIYDPDLGYRLNPKFGDHNPDGLRDHPIGPKGNRFRILFLGDSVIYYGTDVDDTAVGYMRKELRKDPANERLDVIDAGIRGYTNYQELLFLKKYGLKFQPDLVGVQFCLNDLHKFLHSFIVEDGKIITGSYKFSEEALNAQKSFSQQLIRKSFLLTWFDNKFYLLSKVRRAHFGFPFDLPLDTGKAWRDEAWKDIEAQANEFVRLAKQHDFQLFYIVVPIAGQYQAEYLRRDRNYVLKPQKKLKEICNRAGIPFYDLYPELRADFYQKDGIHLNDAGRRKVGQLVAGFLRKSNLLPER